MFVICEKCHQLYQIPEDLVNKSHHFRCAVCQNIFYATPSLSPVSNESDETQTVPFIDVAEVPPTVDEMPDDTQPHETEENQTNFISDFPIHSKDDDTLESAVKSAPYQNPLETSLQQKEDVFSVISDKQPQKDKKKSFILISVLFLFILLTGLFILGRYELVRQFPNLLPFYQKIGLPTTIAGNGIEIKNVTFNFVLQSTYRSLNIKGNLYNPTDMEKQIPALIFDIRNQKGRIVKRQETSLPISKINAGETLSFDAEVLEIPNDSLTVDISFKPEHNL